MRNRGFDWIHDIVRVSRGTEFVYGEYRAVFSEMENLLIEFLTQRL